MSRRLADHIIRVLGEIELRKSRSADVDAIVNGDNYAWLDLGEPIRYQQLFEACQTFWQGQHLETSWERGRRSRLVQFSRTIQSLVADGVLDGLALAWVNVADEIVFMWQGGGRSEGRFRRATGRNKPASLRSTTIRSAAHNAPRIKMVQLSMDLGWPRYRELAAFQSCPGSTRTWLGAGRTQTTGAA